MQAVASEWVRPLPAANAAGAQSAWALRMTGIHKRFGPVAANADVNFCVRAGSLHGLIGENGAGKSTLMSVLYGLYQADQGHIEVFGRRAEITCPDDAIALGIGMVHQHFMLVDTLSALDNIMLGAEGHWHLGRAQARVRPALEALMQQTGLHIKLDALVNDLPVGDRQRLEILKTLFRGARILLLDEPTAMLTPQEAQQLFAVLRTLRDQGTTVVLITHKLKEVMALCDTVTVMRAGRVVQEMPVAQADVDLLAHAMVGRKVQMGRSQALGKAPGEVLLHAQGLVWSDASKVRQVDDVALELRAGQITGLAGVSGNGQTPLLEILSGLRAPDAGRVALSGQTFEAAQWLDPQTARHLGLAHVPEDRQARALVMEFAAWESGVLGYEATADYSQSGWMRHAAMQSDTQNLMTQFDVQPRNAFLRSSSFSGGNQQKLVLAREFHHAPRVLLVGQPTRGVDIGAIEFIYARLRALRDAGCAIFLVSSELDEILALSDRVMVMHQGRVVGDLDVAECSELVLGRLMSGGTP